VVSLLRKAVVASSNVSCLARSKDGLYETALADSEREAVADLLQYLENVSIVQNGWASDQEILTHLQRAETDFFRGDPLRSLSTLVYSENVDLQRSASLTFAEITERGQCSCTSTF
jgi:vacuolar protein 8